MKLESLFSGEYIKTYKRKSYRLFILTDGRKVYIFENKEDAKKKYDNMKKDNNTYIFFKSENMVFGISEMYKVLCIFTKNTTADFYLFYW